MQKAKIWITGDIVIDKICNYPIDGSSSSVQNSSLHTNDRMVRLVLHRTGIGVLQWQWGVVRHSEAAEREKIDDAQGASYEDVG